jgi:hypothetical protein
MKNFITTSIAVLAVVSAMATETGLKVGMYNVAGTEKLKVFVDAKGKTQVRIKDAQGRAISSQTLKGSQGIAFDLSAAPAGSYSLEVSNGTELITKPLTKK